MRGDDDARRAVLEYVSRPDYRPLTQRELLHRLHVAPGERADVRRSIGALLREGRLARRRGGRLALRAGEGERASVTGVLRRHRDGYGFVIDDAGGPDVFVAAPNLGAQLSGDRVAVQVTRQSRGNRLEGVVVRTVEKRPRTMLGVFGERGPGGGEVRPFESGLPSPFPVPVSSRLGARDGDVVSFEVVPAAGAAASSPAAKVLEVLGRFDDPRMDERIVTRKYGLARGFPDETLSAAERLPRRVGPKRGSARKRFDDPRPVTIDGESARDFDDAIAVAARPRGGFRLFVHIADVAEFARAGDALDREARRRGTSVYFPHSVVPMFPEALSNGICSLVPGVDRLVQSVILELDREGEVTSVRFADGIIRSAARLTYTQAAQVLEGDDDVPGVPGPVVPMLRAGGRLAELLRAKRERRGSVDFDLPEPQILLDVEGAMTGITLSPRNRAHRLIEEFMLAANEAVARWLDERVGACVYRVHEAPDAAKLETLAHFVGRFGLRFPTADVGPLDVQRLLAQVEGRPEARLVASAALRAMRQARYSTTNAGHFSLASPCYCHFTSPIRRYPDLLVHRLLRAARAGSRPSPEERQRLDALSRECSELERNAEAAEREVLTRKKVAFIASQVGEAFDAVVTGVASFGAFAQLEANLVEGLLRVERLGDERFELDSRREELRGVHTGRVLRAGQRLRVRVERVDRVLQRVDLGLAGEYERSERTAPAGGRRRRARRSGAVVQ
jgi:ribonuclease R